MGLIFVGDHIRFTGLILLPCLSDGGKDALLLLTKAYLTDQSCCVCVCVYFCVIGLVMFNYGCVVMAQ